MADEESKAFDQAEYCRKVEHARRLLLEIARSIRELEGFPIDFGLATKLTDLLHRIEGSV